MKTGYSRYSELDQPDPPILRLGGYVAVFHFLAVLATILFTGAAIYINIAEHPARMECGTAVAVAVFGPRMFGFHGFVGHGLILHLKHGQATRQYCPLEARG